jgi:hypothetical protein
MDPSRAVQSYVWLDIHISNLARLAETIVRTSEVVVGNVESGRDIAERCCFISPIEFCVAVIDVAVRGKKS